MGIGVWGGELIIIAIESGAFSELYFFELQRAISSNEFCKSFFKSCVRRPVVVAL